MSNPDEYYDYPAAEKEGWFISQTNTAEGWRLEKCDEKSLFETDVEVHAFVCRRAVEKSENHRRALEWLIRNAPEEAGFVLQNFTNSVIAGK